MNNLKENTKYNLLITIMKYSACIIMTVFLLAIVRTLFNHTIHINFNKEWIQWIFEIIIVLFVACICYIFLFPRGIQRISNLFSSSIQEWKNIIFVSINLGVIVNYFLVNGSITYNTRDLLSDLFDGIMIVAILSVVAFFGRFVFKEPKKDISKKEDITDPDQPIEKIEQDLLNRGNFAKTISDTLNKISNKSLTIGIFGEWGSGKSSFYNMVKEHSQTEKQEITYIEFKPWYFSTSDDLVKRFLVMLLEEVERDGGYDPNLKKELKKYVDILSSVSVRSFNSIISLKEIFSKIMPGPEDSDISIIKSKIEKLLEVSNRKIVVYIDDVDRLDGEEIKSIFKLVRLVADFPNIIYIIALDEEIVTSALSTIYSKGDNSQEEARKYIEKFIQVPIYLPKIDRYYLQKLYNNLLNKAFTTTIEGKKIINPHHDNQFIHNALDLNMSLRNIFRFVNLVTIYIPILEKEINPLDLLYLLIIKVNSPKLFNYIYTNEKIFTGAEIINDSHIKRLNDFSRFNNILYFLFPSLRKIIQIDNKNIENFKRDKKICEPEYFKQYFMYSVPVDILSHDELTKFFSELKVDKNVKIQDDLKRMWTDYGIISVISKLEDFSYELGNEQKTNLIQNIGKIFLLKNVPIDSKEYNSIIKLSESFIKQIIKNKEKINLDFLVLDEVFIIKISSFIPKEYTKKYSDYINDFYNQLTLKTLIKEDFGIKRVKFLLENWRKFENKIKMKSKISSWLDSDQNLNDFLNLTFDKSKSKNELYLFEWLIFNRQFFDDNILYKIFSEKENKMILKNLNEDNDQFTTLEYFLYSLNNLSNFLMQEIVRNRIESMNDHKIISFNSEIKSAIELILKYENDTKKIEAEINIVKNYNKEIEESTKEHNEGLREFNSNRENF